MVTDAVISWFLDLVDWLVALIPSSDPLPGVNFSFISDLNYFLPISEMFALFASMFLLGGPLAASSLIIWVVVGVLRGGATKA